MIPCTQKLTIFDKLAVYLADLSRGPTLLARIPAGYRIFLTPVMTFFDFPCQDAKRLDFSQPLVPNLIQNCAQLYANDRNRREIVFI